MSIKAYRVIARAKEGRIAGNYKWNIFLTKEKAERRKKQIEEDWGKQEWFDSCKVQEIEIDSISEQWAVGCGGVRRTVYGLKERDGKIMGYIRKQQKGGGRGRDFDCFEVFFSPERSRWYLVNPDRFLLYLKEVKDGVSSELDLC